MKSQSDNFSIERAIGFTDLLIKLEKLKASGFMSQVLSAPPTKRDNKQIASFYILGFKIESMGKTIASGIRPAMETMNEEIKAK